MTGTLNSDDDLLAAEYVLGVQDAETRARLEQRLRRDTAFAAAVAAWENRLGGMNDASSDMPVPNLLPQIEARLFAKAAATPARRFNWFGIAGAASAAGLAVAVILTTLFLQDPLAPVLTTLSVADLVYEVRSDGETLQVTRLSGKPAPAGQVHEIWLIAPGASPVSLGLLADAALSVAYPTPPAGWALAISVEPAGGAPRGLPTGPVIATQLIPGGSRRRDWRVNQQPPETIV